MKAPPRRTNHLPRSAALCLPVSLPSPSLLTASWYLLQDDDDHGKDPFEELYKSLDQNDEDQNHEEPIAPPIPPTLPSVPNNQTESGWSWLCGCFDKVQPYILSPVFPDYLHPALLVQNDMPARVVKDIPLPGEPPSKPRAKVEKVQSHLR